VTRQKIILTGTPVQNNLEEFFSIIDLVQDDCFGNMAEFKRNFSGPIKKGLQKYARFTQKRNATELIQKLKDIYQPHFIRRTKREIFKCLSSELSLRPLEWNELPLKTDLVVWIPLSKI
jgi:SNF2 family DNA or RNA helicase